MQLDVIKHKIRVILKKGLYSPSSEYPTDMEGTIMYMVCSKDACSYYSCPQRLAKLFIAQPQQAANCVVRWDNDKRLSIPSNHLLIRSEHIDFWTSIWDDEDCIELNRDRRPLSELKTVTILTDKDIAYIRGQEEMPDAMISPQGAPEINTPTEIPPPKYREVRWDGGSDPMEIEFSIPEPAPVGNSNMVGRIKRTNPSTTTFFSSSTSNSDEYFSMNEDSEIDEDF